MNDTAPASPVSKMPFAAEEAVFALGGDTPGHIWVRTCPTPLCDCRIALVLASEEGQDVLLDRASPVRIAAHERSGYSEKAAELKDLIAFELDIDALLLFAPNGAKPLDLALHPEVAAVTTRINSDLLEAIGRLWCHGKGLPDPEQRLLAKGNRLKVGGWRPGQMLGWVEADLDVREDVYGYNERFYGAYDKYCPIADCDCGELIVEFCDGGHWSPPLGHVLVKFDGTVSFVPNRNSEHLLEQLWSMYIVRNPNYLEQFQARDKTIKSLTVVGFTQRAQSTKVGRNDACVCGSGKKFKKCCGA